MTISPSTTEIVNEKPAHRVRPPVEALCLTKARARPHNVTVKLRLILIAFAFVLLAVAGLSHGDAHPIGPLQGGGEATRLSAQPSPDPELPAIVRAAMTAPASAQTLVGFEARLWMLPVPDVSADSRQASAVPAYDVSTPQSFPLLI